MTAVLVSFLLYFFSMVMLGVFFMYDDHISFLNLLLVTLKVWECVTSIRFVTSVPFFARRFYPIVEFFCVEKTEAK